MHVNQAKQKLRSGDCIWGVFANGLSPELVEIMGLAGFDFIVIDSEHASSTPQHNRTLIMAGEARGVSMFTRVPCQESSVILRNLDVGAQGLLVPQVNSRQEAEAIARAARYYPEGFRGVATPRASDYGMSGSILDYMAHANENLLLAVQCENIACVEHLDEIAAVPGIDVIFVGPFDLSQSMGIPGQVNAPGIRAVAAQVLDATARHGKYAGIFASTVEQALAYRDMGFRYIIVGTDMKYFASACKEAVRALHAGEGEES